MCITLFWFGDSDDLLLLLAFNRDEIFDRSTHVAHWWHDKPHILGGRDAVAGGTWLCFGKNGRVSWLTNFREQGWSQQGGPAPSRGELPVKFVEGSTSPLEYLATVNGSLYPGFNLMCADLRSRQLAYLCNRGTNRPEPVTPGLHGVTNGRLDAHWAKVDEGKAALGRLLAGGTFHGGHMPWGEIFRLMSDTRILESDPAKLPKTGYGTGFETACSSIFVQPVETPMGLFGTRSQTVVAVRRDGSAEMRERYRVEREEEWREVVHRFRVQLGPGPESWAGAQASVGPGGEAQQQQGQAQEQQEQQEQEQQGQGQGQQRQRDQQKEEEQPVNGCLAT